MFKVQTDEEILQLFQNMQSQLKQMEEVFQEENKELSANEMANHNQIVNQTKSDFNKLIKQVYKRITLIEK